jgi:hypothetical protein
MRTIHASLRTLAAGAALALALAQSPALAAPASPAAADKDTSLSPAEKLRKELDATITLKFDKQTLGAAVELLRQKTKVGIVLDSVTIQQQLGYLPEQSPNTVDIDVKDAKVRTILRSIVTPFGLSYAPIGDVVVITTEDMAMMRQMRQRISVDMDKVEFTSAMKQISRDTSVNLILDSRVEKQAETKVTLQLEDVPLETAVRLLAEMAGLKPVRVGNVLFVTSKDNAKEMQQDPDIAQPGNPNARAQELQLQQQQLLIQAQLGAQNPGIGFQPATGLPGPPGGISAPPGVAPVVPPSAPSSDAPKEEKPAASDEKAKDQKDPPPPPDKPQGR